MRSFQGGPSAKDTEEEKLQGEGNGESDDNPDGLEGTGDSVMGMKPQDITDTEGWIYDDNKWEGTSGKAGIGKVGYIGSSMVDLLRPRQFMRYRRWTRIAVMTETIEIVTAEEPPHLSANKTTTLSTSPSILRASSFLPPSALASKTPDQKTLAPPVTSPLVEPNAITAAPSARVSGSPEPWRKGGSKAQIITGCRWTVILML
jgi:hypothetical protein